jgi:hypothetical protein
LEKKETAWNGIEKDVVLVVAAVVEIFKCSETDWPVRERP